MINLIFLDFLGADGGDDGIIFPSHPGPIPNVPRDQISRKGIPSLRYGEISYEYNKLSRRVTPNGWI